MTRFNSIQNVVDSLSNWLSTQIKSSIKEEFKNLADQSKQSPDFLTTDELCQKLKFSKSHLEHLRRIHQDFPTHKFGNCIRFKLDEVELFFNSKNTRDEE